MRRPYKHSAAGFVAVALAASSAWGQIYSFETLYDNTDVMNPAGTRPDDFHANGGGGTTVTQSTVGVTNGSFSMAVHQSAGANFTGAQTEVVPGIINDPNTVALSVDVTIPATGAFTGTFARMGISEFGNNDSQGIGGGQVQTIGSSEVNIDLLPGTYHFTIPLIGDSNPVTGDVDVPFSSCFGSDPNSQIVPSSFEFYFNKTSQNALNVYLDNVQAIGPATVGTWGNSGGGSWETVGNWSGGIPQLALDTANFTNAITNDSTVTLGGNHSVATLTLRNSHHYTIASSAGATLTLDAGGSNTATITDSGGTHTISAPIDFNTNTAISVSNPGDVLNISGNISGTGALMVAGSGTVDLSGTNTYMGGTTVSSGVLLIGSASALPIANFDVVQILGAATVKLGANIGGVTLQSVNITPGGTFDINNDHVFLNYSGGGDPIATIASLIASGYAGGSWTGNAITSSAAQSNFHSYGIGYADAADPGNPAGLASGQIEIMYTLLGDANLDGAVNGTDFAIMASNFNKSDQSGHSGWDEGDFNYDGSVNGIDFALLATNFNKGASQSADLAALDSFASANGLLADVPEPGVVGLLASVCCCLLVSRRRRFPVV